MLVIVSILYFLPALSLAVRLSAKNSSVSFEFESATFSRFVGPQEFNLTLPLLIYEGLSCHKNYHHPALNGSAGIAIVVQNV